MKKPLRATTVEYNQTIHQYVKGVFHLKLKTENENCLSDSLMSNFLSSTEHKSYNASYIYIGRKMLMLQKGHTSIIKVIQINILSSISKIVTTRRQCYIKK